ncbi:MAG: BREX-3 system phosphatase PglZ [SAR324 cluster bacterium]|nr:BREX-3 system phosphatase PglZ [SAR324 cluster bacterium]
MNNWRDSILNEFIPKVSKLTLVADPDSLLTEEKLAYELRQRGFELMDFTEAVEFRYAYETNYRSVWDRGEISNLVVILRLQETELESLPYDLLQTGRKLSLKLGEYFPNFSYPVLQKLDRSLLDTLFEAQNKFFPDRMGENSTRDFILRHVYGLAAELITEEVALLRTLLRLHYNQFQLSQDLNSRFVQVLRANKMFQKWPLEQIVPEAKDFFAFLQERWPLFLVKQPRAELTSEEVAEPPQPACRYTGPSLLPFDHQDIRVYLDNLFVEGKLTPVSYPGDTLSKTSWLHCGILNNETTEEMRLKRLFELIAKDIPTEDSRYLEWTTFAMKWAELSALVHCNQKETPKNQLFEVGKELNNTFAKWLQKHYSSLINLPPTQPVMLHHVPRRLARAFEESKNSRIALVVLDGLSLDQWVTLRQILKRKDHQLLMKETSVFAWIPTLTAVSRQALFSGKPPLYFPGTINSTNNEENLWKIFWEGLGLSRKEVAYHRGLGDGKASGILDDLIPAGTKVVGLVVDKVDKIMHGMQLGSAGMHNQLKQWCEEGFLTDLINSLLCQGFELWMTSDHGNVQGRGKGRPSEGSIAEIRGERVRIYPSADLRAQVAKTQVFSQEWEPVGLPSDYFPLVATGYEAFVATEETIVGHGSIALEEVLVPLIQFERRTL